MGRFSTSSSVSARRTRRPSFSFLAITKSVASISTGSCKRQSTTNVLHSVNSIDEEDAEKRVIIDRIKTFEGKNEYQLIKFYNNGEAG